MTISRKYSTLQIRTSTGYHLIYLRNTIKINQSANWKAKNAFHGQLLTCPRILHCQQTDLCRPSSHLPQKPFNWPAKQSATRSYSPSSGHEYDYQLFSVLTSFGMLGMLAYAPLPPFVKRNRQAHWLIPAQVVSESDLQRGFHQLLTKGRYFSYGRSLL